MTQVTEVPQSYRDLFQEITSEARTLREEWIPPFIKDGNGQCIQLVPSRKPYPDTTESQQSVLLLAWRAGASIQQGNSGSRYEMARDIIEIPHSRFFRRQDDRYSCILHGLGHWTGHPERLNRPEHPEAGTPGHAAEEVIAEFVCAMLGSYLDIHPDERHAVYLGTTQGFKKLGDQELEECLVSSTEAIGYLLEFMP